MKVKIKKLHPDAVVPKYATLGAAGFDFVAIEDIEIRPSETKLIKTGLAFAIPEGYEIQVRPRSGLSLKTKLRIGNAPGTLDQDFRGEVCIIIDNTTELYGQKLFHQEHVSILGLTGTIVIKKGDRVAQGVLCPVYQAEFDVVDELDETERNSGGFGSTGIK